MNGRRAVVLLSGGIDSATVASLARAQGFVIHALSVRYGQRHAIELRAARRVADSLCLERHTVVDVDLSGLGGSSLTGGAPIPKGRSFDQMAQGIPNTYVPARNTVLLSLALAYAETVDAVDLFIGANALDCSGYPDCRPEYLTSFENMANLATRMGVQGRRIAVHAPLLRMAKFEIIATGLKHGVDFSLTSTCYDPVEDAIACGRCDACVLRLKGFAELGLQDPATYAPALA